MKKIFVSIALTAIVFSSCDKKEVLSTKEDNSNRQEILYAAKELSVKHDALVQDMLSSCREKVKPNGQAVFGSDKMNMEWGDLFQVIEDVTGIKPEIVQEKRTEGRQLVAGNSEDDLPVYDFDRETISLSQYSNSFSLGNYLASVDKIVLDSMMSISEKEIEINKIQQKVKVDLGVNATDYENFINTTEVLKGSLKLWNNHAGDESRQNASGLMRAKSIRDWPFFSKLAFVAAADAVGAVVGTFIGSYIIIKGVPVYIPAGPQGAAAGLAVLSVIAAKMVGW